MLAALFAATASSIFTQVVPAVKVGGTSQLAVGGGASYFDVDWGSNKMVGYTLWADWRPPFLPHVLNGLHVEFEGRDVHWNNGDKPPLFRETTGGGGVMYEWQHFEKFRPYAKGLMSFGRINLGHTLVGTPQPPYSHDTRTVYAPGGGLEYRVAGNLWVRGDYEYQFWPGLLNKTLDPTGYTVGAMYDLRSFKRR
jgi:opacity protein-like surface antigen